MRTPPTPPIARFFPATPPCGPAAGNVGVFVQDELISHPSPPEGTTDMATPFDPSKLSVAEQVAVLASLKQLAAAKLLSISPRTFRDRLVPRNNNGSYSAFDIIDWLTTQTVPTPDAELSGTDSPALERFRLARARLAELDLESKKGDMLDRHVVRECLAASSGIYRRAGARLRREFGDEAYQVMDEAYDDAIRVLDMKFVDDGARTWEEVAAIFFGGGEA